jgi:hypothetical protein
MHDRRVRCRESVLRTQPGYAFVLEARQQVDAVDD